MPRLTFRLCTTFIVFLGTMQTVQAQLMNAEVLRGLNYPGTTPYDGTPFTQRYSYSLYSPLIYVGNTRNLVYMDYLDRVDRAMKFGYPMPPDPFCRVAPPVQPLPPGAQPMPSNVQPLPPNAQAPTMPVGSGFGGFGFFRRR